MLLLPKSPEHNACFIRDDLSLHFCWVTTLGIPQRWNSKLAPGHGEQREIGERGRTLQVGRCSFNKQRNLHMGFVYGGWKTSKFSTFACQNPKSFIESLTGFNHVCSPDGRSNTLLKAASLKWLLVPGIGCQMCIPRTRKGCKGLLVIRVQRVGQYAVMTFWPPPTISLLKC